MPESLESRLESLDVRGAAGAPPCPAEFLARVRRRRWQRRSPAIVTAALALAACAAWWSVRPVPAVSNDTTLDIVRSDLQSPDPTPVSSTWSVAALRIADPSMEGTLPPSDMALTPAHDPVLTPLAARSAEEIERLATSL